MSWNAAEESLDVTRVPSDIIKVSLDVTRMPLDGTILLLKFSRLSLDEIKVPLNRAF